MPNIDFNVFQIFIIYELTINPDIPIYEMYKNLRKAVNCDFRLFEHLYMKFRKGNYDLTYIPMNDRVSLMDLSDVILLRIIGYLDFAAQMLLRCTSHQFQDLVDKSELQCKTLSIRIKDQLELIINQYFSLRFVFCGKETMLCKESMMGTSQRIIRDQEKMQTMMKHLGLIFRSQKLNLDSLEIDVDSKENESEFFEAFQDAVKSLLNVKKVKISAPNNPTIIKFLKPENLEFIHLKLEPSSNHGAILESEQWKKAKIVKLEGFLLNPGHIEHIMHLQGFDGHFEELSPQNMQKLSQNFLQNSNFQFCDIRVQTPVDIAAVDDIIGPFIYLSDSRPHYKSISIPETDEYLEIDIDFNNFGVQKVGKELKGLCDLIRFL